MILKSRLSLHQGKGTVLSVPNGVKHLVLFVKKLRSSMMVPRSHLKVAQCMGTGVCQRVRKVFFQVKVFLFLKMVKTLM